MDTELLKHRYKTYIIDQLKKATKKELKKKMKEEKRRQREEAERIQKEEEEKQQVIAQETVTQIETQQVEETKEVEDTKDEEEGEEEGNEEETKMKKNIKDVIKEIIDETDNSNVTKMVITDKFKPKEEKQNETLEVDLSNLKSIVDHHIKNGSSNMVLYVTSFAKDMYVASGKHLIDTFMKYYPNHFLLVCYEGFDFKPPSPKILGYNLETSKFLRQWLKENKHNIPVSLGGTATSENNPKLFAQGFNKNASRWFRKIVSLEYGVNVLGDSFKSVIWLDADCYATGFFSDNSVKVLFNKHDVFYHMGHYRRKKNMCVESSIIGFKKGNGYKFLNHVANIYQKGHYVKYIRWDDGWIFKESINHVVNNHPDVKDVKTVDLLGHLPPEKCKSSHVVCSGVFAKYFVHEKGKHNKIRKMGLKQK